MLSALGATVQLFLLGARQLLRGRVGLSAGQDVRPHAAARLIVIVEITRRPSVREADLEAAGLGQSLADDWEMRIRLGKERAEAPSRGVRLAPIGKMLRGTRAMSDNAIPASVGAFRAATGRSL